MVMMVMVEMVTLKIMMMMMLIKDCTNYIGLDQGDHDNENDDDKMVEDNKNYFPATPLTCKREIPQESGFHFEASIFLCVSLSLSSIDLVIHKSHTFHFQLLSNMMGSNMLHLPNRNIFGNF